MRRLLALLLPILALAAAPVAAQVVTVSETVEVTQYISEGSSERYVATAPAELPRGIAKFGPFRVLDSGRAALVDATDEGSPAQFEAMLRAYPGIALIETVLYNMLEGGYISEHDRKIGRQPHAAVDLHAAVSGMERLGIAKNLRHVGLGPDIASLIVFPRRVVDHQPELVQLHETLGKHPLYRLPLR